LEFRPVLDGGHSFQKLHGRGVLVALPQFLHTFLLFLQLSNLFFQPESCSGFTRCVIGAPTKANLSRTI
jgi:hypothetical protein